MTAWYRLELDPEQCDSPWITDSRGEVREWHCEACRTTWFDPIPGPLAVDVDAPEDGWSVFGVGALPGESPILVVQAAVVEALNAAGIDSFEPHPVTVEAVDGESTDDVGPPWLALWPTGTAGVVVGEDGDALADCEGCGRLPGEFAEPWSGRLTGEGAAGDVVAVPGWRHTTFVSARAWEALQAAGVQFLRAVPVGA